MRRGRFLVPALITVIKLPGDAQGWCSLCDSALQPSDPQQPPGAPGPTKVDLGPEGDEQGVLSGLQ